MSAEDEGEAGGELLDARALFERRRRRVARQRAIEEQAQTRHPSNRGQGLEGLLADIKGFSLPQRETIRDIFAGGTDTGKEEE